MVCMPYAPFGAGEGLTHSHCSQRRLPAQRPPPGLRPGSDNLCPGPLGTQATTGGRSYLPSYDLHDVPQPADTPRPHTAAGCPLWAPPREAVIPIHRVTTSSQDDPTSRRLRQQQPHSRNSPQAHGRPAVTPVTPRCRHAHARLHLAKPSERP